MIFELSKWRQILEYRQKYGQYLIGFNDKNRMHMRTKPNNSPSSQYEPKKSVKDKNSQSDGDQGWVESGSIMENWFVV